MAQMLDKTISSIKIVLITSGVIILSLFAYDKYTTQQEEAQSVQQPEVEEQPYQIPAYIQEILDGAQVDNSETRESEEQEYQVPASHKLQQSGWIPSWGYSQGLASLTTNARDFSTVMPVWYSVKNDGSLIDKRPANIFGLTNVTRDYDIRLIPSVALFDADLLKEVLEGQSLFDHVDFIVSEVVNNGYDGIDIDYESTYEEDGEAFETFIKLLGNRLKDKGKILSITVLSQWGDDVVYSGLKQTRKVQDWDMIAKYAHEVRIMTYDYTSSGSTKPGPIGPIDWQKDVLDYAVTKFDRDKIWLGIHLYGYSWNSVGLVGAYTYDDIPTLLQNEIKREYSYIYEEGYAEYLCGGDTCKIYYQSPAGVKARLELAKDYGLAGVAYWRLGEDGALLTGQDIQ